MPAVCGAIITVAERSVSTVVLGTLRVVTVNGTSASLSTRRDRSTTDEPVGPVMSAESTETDFGSSEARQAPRTAAPRSVVDPSIATRTSSPGGVPGRRTSTPYDDGTAVARVVSSQTI